MLKKLVLLLCMGMYIGSLCAQSQVENMFRDAKEYNKAFLEKDFTKYTEMTVPSIVEIAGGKEVMTKVSKEYFETLSSSDMKYVSIHPEKPGYIVIAGEELHAILPQKVITKFEDDQYERTVYYLACSIDEGKSWTFADLEPYDQETIKQFVPSFTGDLSIPEVEVAVKIEN